MLTLRNITTILMTITLISGLTACSEDDAVIDPNIDRTTSYKVEYVPGMMVPMQGKTQFQIIVTNRSNGQAVTGETVKAMPMMYMSDRTHATPVDGNCVESTTEGTYDCTVYYLMADTMNGVTMGYWELEIMIGGMNGETALFEPSVMMAMGDTARADLKGVTDQVMNMMSMMEERKYHIFKSSLKGMTGNHDFEIFIAATESMMSFPTLINGVTFNAGETYELTAHTIMVEASTDLSTWVTATDNGNGYWTASSLTGLTDGAEGNIYIRLSVSNEQKTVDGELSDGTNDYATFKVTPGMSM